MPTPFNRLTKIRLHATRTSLLAACVLLAALSQSFLPTGSVEARRAPVKGEAARRSDDYGKLPLRFEANRGQTDKAVKFLARGSGYTLFLAETGAVLRLRAAGAEGEEQRFGTLRLTLEGANRKPSVSGLDEQPGRSNYLIGADARAWRTGVPAFGRVRYEAVYKGIDAVYYGRQGRLEYDFVVAPGADPSHISLRFDGARKVRVDEKGDLVISTDCGDVGQQRPFAYQEFDGERREVRAVYAVDARGRVRFELGDYDRARTLVIDPVLLYASYLGGTGNDQGMAVAVDAAGSAYVAGMTTSTDYPHPSSLQTANGGFRDAFVLKLAPDGKSLVYATYLGGNGDDFGTSVGVDTAGNAYVGGFSSSSNFATTAGSFQPSNAGIGDAFLVKLNQTGTGLVYSTYIGGKGTEQVNSVAVDAAGAAYVAGRTDSVNFTNAPAVNRAGSPVYKSTDGGASWGASGSGLTSTVVNDFAVVPGSPNVVYAGATLGVYKSTDGGTSWQLMAQANPLNAPFNVRSVVVAPSNTSIVYAATGSGSGVYKSIDGGVTFEGKGSGLFVPIVNTLVVHPTNPSIVYAGTRFGVFKTTNGGESWTESDGPIFGSPPQITKLVIDSANPQTLYAATVSRGVLKTIDGGANWVQVNNGLTGQFGSILQPRTLALDPSNPSIIYVSVAGSFSLNGGGIFKTIDGGANWTSSGNGLTATVNGQTISPAVNAILVDPASPSNIYAATNGYGIYKSTDGGANWASVNNGLANRTVLALAARSGSPAALLAGTVAGGDPFVLKLNPTGSAAEYVRMLGGSENDDARTVALGPSGSVYVTGTTASFDFPTANARQAALNGVQDAIVVKLDSNGNTVYSTYLGGSSYDLGAGLAVGTDGSAYVVGLTASADFPTVNPIKSTLSGLNDFQDGFVSKLSPDGQTLVYSTHLGGTNIDQATGVAVGADGSAHVVGSTGSPDFPLAGAAYAFAGSQDAFVTKLNPAGTALVYSTNFGGNDFEQINAVALDGAGGIYVTGATSSTNLPLTNAAQGTVGGNEDAFIAKFGPGIDLVVTMSDSPDPVAFGADLTYTVKVKNNGDLPATGVQLTDTLPAGATLVSVVSDRGSCSGTTTIVCVIGTLGAAEEANVTIKVKPPATLTINNTAVVTLNESDTNSANNSAAAQTTVDFADLAVTKSALVGTVAPGSKVLFLLTVTNRSGAAAPSVTLSDVLPAGLTFSSCDAPGGVCGGSGSSRTVTFTSLAVGTTASATIAATLDPAAAAGTVFNNTATVSSAFPDNDSSNNSASASVTAAPFAARARTNGKVVLASDDGIYIVNADGTGRTKIHTPPANSSVHDPVWSPDGTKIVFRRYVSGASFPATTYDFYVMEADGSNPRRVAGSSTESRATWSPNGSHVAFVKYNASTNRYDLYAARVDGAGEVRIASVPDIATNFDWSPDGSRFVFEKNHQHVFVMDADGSNQRQLTFTEQTADGPTRDEEPLWTFDGTRITFTRRNNVMSNVNIINADGTGLRRLLNEYTFHGQLSPDGTKFATDGVYVKNVDESVYRYPLGNGHDPSWQSLSNPTPTPTPAPPEVFSISGHITSNGSGYYPIRLSGTRAVVISTDSAGNYTFFNLPKGGTYTVTPLGPGSNSSYVFTPGSRTVSDLVSNVTNFDFTVSRIPRTVSGRVMDTAGNPLAGMRVTDSPGNPFFGGTTDAQGRYSINLGDGPFLLSFQIFSSTYSFDPVRASVEQPPGDLTINYVGAPYASVGSLQGRIIDTSGFGIGGVMVTLGGARNAVVRTNDDGNYVFYNLPVGQDYTITPMPADGLSYAPAQRSYQNLGATQTGFEQFVANAALPSAQFTVTNATVAENARVVELTVTRGPDPQLTAYLDFETSDLTASERSDYIAATGSVRFAPGETSQKVRVLITDDSLFEGERAFKVSLTGGRNVYLGATREAVVRITDDEVSTLPSNPLDASEFFVRQHYADFLNREPDAPGLEFWTNEIEQCGQNAQCREVKRINVSAAFFLSIEFQQTGFLVYRLHQTAFGTGEKLRPKLFTNDTREIGRDLVVGAVGWEEKLEANKRAFIEEFVTRPEFRFAYPLTMPNTVFVDTLNTNTGGSLTQGERDALVAGLTSGATTRAQALRAVAENAQFTRRETNRAFVLMQYFGYLRRSPAAPPDSNFSGWQFWLNKLNEFNGDYIQAEMVKAFITSDEYRKRFGKQ